MSDAGAARGDTDEQPPLEQIAAARTTTLILLVAFGLLALDVAWFWIVFPVGFGGVLPAVIGLVRYYDTTDTSDQSAADSDDAVATPKRQYARGEIDEAEFERQLENLLEIESDEVEAQLTAADREAARE
jgi:uncharacterized membrane protein